MSTEHDSLQRYSLSGATMGTRYSAVLYAPAGLRGAEICLAFPSVGATETLLLAAATAQGQTMLHGAAKEPEIADLAAFLNACGGSVLLISSKPPSVTASTVTCGWQRTRCCHVADPAESA